MSGSSPLVTYVRRQTSDSLRYFDICILDEDGHHRGALPVSAVDYAYRYGSVRSAHGISEPSLFPFLESSIDLRSIRQRHHGWQQ